ncbi:MAG: hypothetical protein JW807_03555 [Spirochaetes bacterium]|nr:hypothetical protein [Spirochaetota bacterium]
MSNKGFWYFLMFGSICLFALCIALGYYLFPDRPFLKWIFFIGLLVFHMAEIPAASMKIGTDRNIPASTVAAKTMLFGFTWWLPLKKGILDK